jgi:hypothetical protein
MLYLLFALLDRWLVPVPPAERVGWLRGRVYAHRGLHRAGVPENSLAAFALAIERGLGSNAMCSAPAMARRWCSMTGISIA